MMGLPDGQKVLR